LAGYAVFEDPDNAKIVFEAIKDKELPSEDGKVAIKDFGLVEGDEEKKSMECNEAKKL